MAFTHIPDDETKYVYLYPPAHVAIQDSRAKRVRRFGIDGPSSGKSDEWRTLESQGWTTSRWAKTLYDPDSTPDNVMTKVAYSPEQYQEFLEDGYLDTMPTELHPHANDSFRQRWLKRKAEKEARQAAGQAEPEARRRGRPPLSREPVSA